MAVWISDYNFGIIHSLNCEISFTICPCATLEKGWYPIIIMVIQLVHVQIQSLNKSIAASDHGISVAQLAAVN